MQYQHSDWTEDTSENFLVDEPPLRMPDLRGLIYQFGIKSWRGVSW